jgi:threonine/homoserine/homoserine lactone efflux protein
VAFDPIYAFVFAGLLSPGPNVILLTASGARFGFRATLPHVAGVVLGVGVVAGLTGLGLGTLLLAQPALTIVLKLAAAGWILWMAYALARKARGRASDGPDTPWTLQRAALFQWVNAKLWAICVAAAAGFSAGLPPLREGMRLALVFSGTNFFVCLFWSMAGSLLIYLLRTPAAWRGFNLAVAAALAASAVMVFL